MKAIVYAVAVAVVLGIGRDIICGVAVWPEDGREPWHRRCLLIFELLLIRGDSWAVGQSPLPFSLSRTSRSPRPRAKVARHAKKREEDASDPVNLAEQQSYAEQIADGANVAKPVGALRSRSLAGGSDSSGQAGAEPVQLTLW